jgi:hypothetical protein
MLTRTLRNCGLVGNGGEAIERRFDVVRRALRYQCLEFLVV